MELERNHTFYHSFEPVVDTTLFREETTEAIVPDACPDIQAILETEGAVFLKEKNVYEGRVEVTGEVRAAIVYQPEGEAEVRHLDVKIPFTCSAEHGGITGNTHCTAVPYLRMVDARALNPRKVLVRAEVAVGTTIHTARESQLLSALMCEEASGVQQQTEQVRSFLTVCAEEKSFQFSDNLKLPSGSCGELLKARAIPNCAEAKIIGNKLIFKGEVRLEALYRSTSGLESAKFELPFSQIMEVSNASEESLVSVTVTPSDLICEPEGENRENLSVSMTLFAQAIVEEERTFSVVRDVYSTAYELSVTAESLALRQLAESGTLPVTMRELVEAPSQIRRVVDCHVMMGQCSAAEEEGRTVLTAPVTVCALCQDENDAFLTVSSSFPAVCRLEQPSGCLITAACELAGEAYATPAAGGLEARLPVRFRYTVTSAKQIAVVADISLDEEKPCCTDGMPSLVLRPVLDGEKLWDVAKSCRTTVEELVKANELAEGEPVCGRMLLIPMRR